MASAVDGEVFAVTNAAAAIDAPLVKRDLRSLTLERCDGKLSSLFMWMSMSSPLLASSFIVIPPLDGGVAVHFKLLGANAKVLIQMHRINKRTERYLLPLHLHVAMIALNSIDYPHQSCYIQVSIQVIKANIQTVPYQHAINKKLPGVQLWEDLRFRRMQRAKTIRMCARENNEGFGPHNFYVLCVRRLHAMHQDRHHCTDRACCMLLFLKTSWTLTFPNN